MSENDTERTPSAGDSSDYFASLSLPFCDDEGCDSDPDYLTKFGAFCGLHAWTRGIDRFRAGRSLIPENDRRADE